MAIFLKKQIITAKASQQYDIPTKILKLNSDSFGGRFCGNINQCISKSMFPSDLTLIWVGVLGAILRWGGEGGKITPFSEIR